jgi:hypothetical protein
MHTNKLCFITYYSQTCFGPLYDHHQGNNKNKINTKQQHTKYNTTTQYYT